MKPTANHINRTAGVQFHKANIKVSFAKELKPGSIERTNIVLVRIMKTGSTTACGVIRNIAAHHNLTGAFAARSWLGEAGEPGVWAAHGALNTGEYGPNPSIYGLEDEPLTYDDKYPDWTAVQSLVSPTFLWTMVRDPRERARSHYYWLVSRRSKPSSTKDKLLYFSQMTGNEIYRYIRPTAKHTVQQVVDTYGLIGLTERYDESLVVLAATLKVPLSEILYLRLKDSSVGFVDPAGIMHNAAPTFDEEPQSVKDFLTKDFAESHKLDYELYDLANKTLDAKIKAMKLEPAIKAFKVLLAAAQKECAVPGTDNRAISDLVKCYSKDAGCNYECLSRYDGTGRKMCTWCS